MGTLRDAFAKAGDKILSIDGPLTEADISLARQAESGYARVLIVEELINKWGQQQDAERKLRGIYAAVILSFLAAETIVGTVAMFLIATECLRLDKWVASTFFAAVFAKIAAISLAVCAYLFPKGGVAIPAELVAKLAQESNVKKGQR